MTIESLFSLPLRTLCRYMRDSAVQDEFELVKSTLLMQIDTVTTEAVNSGYDLKVIESARFAVCAYIDEKLKENISVNKVSNLNVCQRKFYKTDMAGEKFFTRLSCLMANPDDSISLYYICILLGFRGKMILHDDRFYPNEILDTLENTLASMHKQNETRNRGV